MAELTWLRLPPLRVQSHGGQFESTLVDGGLHVDRADPRILVSAELLDLIKHGDTPPWVTLDGDVLRIDGVNRTVLYRIGEELPEINAYWAEWPD